MISRPHSRPRKQREFASVEHLSPEAVAGYVDNELPPIAMNRARIHLVHCAECRAEVIEQRRAAERLRKIADEQLHAPSTLMARLTSIAQSCPDGPDAHEVAHPRGESIVAKVEVFYRAVRKNQGK